MENQKDEFIEWFEKYVNFSPHDNQVSENFVNEVLEPVNLEDLAEGGDLVIEEQVATEIDDVFFEGLPEYLPRSERGKEKCVIPVSAEDESLLNELLTGDQNSLGSSSQTQGKRKRAKEEANKLPTQHVCIVAPFPQKKRLILTVRVKMPSLGIHNEEFMVEVNASDKVKVLKQKLRDIAGTRIRLPSNESYFFIHLQDGIDGPPLHIPLINRETWSFEGAGVIRDGSIILAVSPSLPQATGFRRTSKI